MTNIRIATWNIKNSYFNIHENEMKAAAVIQLLKEENLDLLSLQEVNSLLARKIERNLKELEGEYQITTSYEKTFNPIKNLRIEYNMIISRLCCCDVECNWDLPSIPKKISLHKLPSIRIRSLVSQKFEDNLYVNNTHLDFIDDELSKNQLLEVLETLKIQSEFEYEPILTGTLNCQPLEQNMIDFTEKLSQIGMKVVDNPQKTYVGHNEEKLIDYVAVPNTWKVESVKTLRNYHDISSHRPIVVKTKKKI